MSVASGVAFIFRWLLVACFLTSMSAQAASTVTYYHNDVTGSPLVATDASGHVLWRESYRPYGERLVNSAAAKGNDVWFTSRRQDAETGLVYMGARYYDPVAGRFVSIDPKGFDESNFHAFNRYAYANDNPLKFRDPNGKWSIFVNENGPSDAAARSYNASVRSTFGGATDAVAAVMRKYLLAMSAMATVEGGGLPIRLASRELLEPNGVAIGAKWRGAGEEIRTVSPEKWHQVVTALKDLGASAKEKAGYKGEWFELPQGAGEFGVRDSDRSGPTLDLNIPGSSVEKIHQSAHE